MVIQYIKFKTELTEQEVIEVARKREPQVSKVPGLNRTYYLKPHADGFYGGMYVWETKEDMDNYRKSDLGKRIPDDYKIIGTVEIQVMDVFMSLHE